MRKTPIQNIPIKTELGRKIRSALLPKPGFIFCNTGWSQLEERIYAESLLFSGKSRA